MLRAKQAGTPGRNNESRIFTSSQRAQGGKIEMIVMIVAKQYRMDVWHILDLAHRVFFGAVDLSKTEDSLVRTKSDLSKY